jgi:hypothetical protein
VQLFQEIQTLPEDDPQPRATAILKAENRLSVEDAKQVEEAFAARMAARGASSDALATDEPMSAPNDPSQPQPPVASIPVKRPRERPKKFKISIDVPDASLIPSPSAIADNPARFQHLFKPTQPKSKKASL